VHPPRIEEAASKLHCDCGILDLKWNCGHYQARKFMITESNSTRADLAVLNRVGGLILLVEIKNRLGTTKAWATAYRRNLIGDGFLPNVPFFLIATPDHFYVWKDAPLTAELREPDYDLNPSAFLTSLPAEIRSLPIFSMTNLLE
jgi:hypothetical protein